MAKSPYPTHVAGVIADATPLRPEEVTPYDETDINNYDSAENANLLNGSLKVGPKSPTVMQEVKLDPEPNDARFGTIHRYKDLGVGVTFLLQLTVALAINAVGTASLHNGIENLMAGGSQRLKSKRGLGSDEDVDLHPAVFIIPLALSLAVALALALFVFLRKNAKGATYAALGLPIAALAVVGAVSLPFNLGAALTFIAPAAILAYITYTWRGRIDLAIGMLEIVTNVMSANPAMYTASIIGFMVQIFYFVFVAVGFTGFALSRLERIEQYEDRGVSEIDIELTPGTEWALAYLLVSGYWTLQFIPTALQTILSGAFASHYFHPNAVVNSVRSSATRALTTSFGSIALGSFVVLIAQTVYNTVSALTRANPLVNACCDCGLGFILSALKYFNKYAFAHVAIYGKDYGTAARDTWELLKRSGITLIINDNLVGYVMGALSFTVGLMSAFFGFVVAMTTLPDYRDYASMPCPADMSPENCADVYALELLMESAGIGAICWIVGVVVMQILVKVVDSGVATTFVVVAEDRQVFKRSFPQFYNKLESVYPEVAKTWVEEGL